MTDITTYLKKVYPKDWEKVNWKDLIFFYSKCAPPQLFQEYNTYYSRSNNYQPPPVSRLWVPIWSVSGILYKNIYPPREWWANSIVKGFKDNSIVELTHVRDDNPLYKVYGYWTYYAKGSGVKYNLGKTIVAKNKVEMLVNLGMSRREIIDILGDTNYLINPLSPVNSVQELAKKLFRHSDNPLEQLLDILLGKQGYTTNRDVLYAIDRVNNTSDFDEKMIKLAKSKGYDSIQLTTQANGNGGWGCEIVFVNVNPLDKVRESDWGGWTDIKKRLVGCTVNPLNFNFMLTCNEQDLGNCFDDLYEGYFAPQEGSLYPIILLSIVLVFVLTSMVRK